MAVDKYYYTSGDNVHVAGTITLAGREILDDANAAAQATTLGLGTGDTPTFAGLNVGNININGSTIQHDAGTPADLTIKNLDQDKDIIFSVDDGGITKTIKLDASAFEWVSSTFVHTFAGQVAADSLVAGGLVIGNMTINSNNIINSLGAISFSNENLTTTGSFGCDDLTATGKLQAGATNQRVYFVANPAYFPTRNAAKYIMEGSGLGESQLVIMNTEPSSSSKGGGFIIGHHDNAYLASGHRMGYILFGGGIPSGAFGRGCGISGYTTELWNATGRGSKFEFQAAPNGSTSRSTIMTVLGDGVEINTGIIDYKGTMGDGSDDPTTDAPTDWVEVEINGTTRYLPAYT